MLPFLQKRQLASVIIAKQKPEGSLEEDMPNDGLQAALSDLMRAMKSDDAVAAARAFKSAFEMCESYEGESE